jgi:hypothetical protein
MPAPAVDFVPQRHDLAVNRAGRVAALAAGVPFRRCLKPELPSARPKDAAIFGFAGPAANDPFSVVG